MDKFCKLVLVSPAIKWGTRNLPPQVGMPADLQVKNAVLELSTIIICSLMQIGGKVMAFPLIVNYTSFIIPCIRHFHILTSDILFFVTIDGVIRQSYSTVLIPL